MCDNFAVMEKKINIVEFLTRAKTSPVIDVRSPLEYGRGHIPNAINIPLFSDEERKLIGTLYKKVSKDAALEKGLDLVGPKMSDWVRKCRQLSTEHSLLIHCWRGGMRSESFAWLLRTAGINCLTLEDGYKSYRNHLLKKFESEHNLIVLTGSTGSGKTEVLRSLKELGEQVIDLEALALHKGSVFGGLGQDAQPTTEQFQNELFHQLDALDSGERIWIEDESISIGEVRIPYEFWSHMVKSPVIQIKVDKEVRIQRLVQEYGLFPTADLTEKIKKISKRLGGLATRSAIETLQANELAKTVEILLYYYDKAYNNCLERKNSLLIDTLECKDYDSNDLAKALIQRVNQFKETKVAYG